MMTAQQYGNKGKQLREISQRAIPLVKRLCRRPTGPRPDSDEPLKKTSFYTKVGDQICGVGYYRN
jgi:hypothetical protein